MGKYEKYIGQLFDGRYRIDKLIGVGGMAVVYEGFDTKDEHRVAIKLLREEIAHDVESVKRFINESKAVAMLNHPNIVKIYNVAVSDELKYIVMEHIDGITLKQYMKSKGALSIKSTLAISEQILCALEHAHSKGIIHRDIKPHNIMLLKNGKVIVTDFGIAMLPHTEVEDGEKAIGTVFYISPEQASGKATDSRSDLYSLGVMMYEMSTGLLPFNAEKPVEVALMQVNKAPQPPREINPAVPKGLEQIILGAMEKDPDNRFQSASEMLFFLRQLKNDPFKVFSLLKSEPGTTEKIPFFKRIKKFFIQKVFDDHPFNGNTSMLPIILGTCFAFLIVAIISGYYIIQNIFVESDLNVFKKDAVKNIEVENFVNSTYTDEFRNQLESSGYNISVEYENSKDFAKNQIIEQDPAAGSIRKSGKFTLELKVSLGVDSSTLDDYSMLDYRQVKLAVEKLGLRVVVETVDNEAIDYGYVIKTKPTAGSSVASGDSVTLYVSSGPKLEDINIPKFTGLTEEQALALLESSGLRLGNISTMESDTVEAGMIISQSIAKDSVKPKGSFISFVISTGKPGNDPADNETDIDTDTDTDTDNNNDIANKDNNKGKTKDN